jgi:hypothetical protein
MRLAVISERCEVVAAFTNPTLHRIISQHFFCPVRAWRTRRFFFELYYDYTRLWKAQQKVTLRYDPDIFE